MLFLNVSMIVADRVAPSAVPVGSYRLAVSSACLMLKLSLQAKHNPFYQPFKCNSTICPVSFRQIYFLSALETNLLLPPRLLAPQTETRASADGAASLPFDR